MSPIHVFSEYDLGQWEVWLDTEVAERDGLCLGTGPTKAEALADAETELREALKELEALDR